MLCTILFFYYCFIFFIFCWPRLNCRILYGILLFCCFSRLEFLPAFFPGIFRTRKFAVSTAFWEPGFFFFCYECLFTPYSVTRFARKVGNRSKEKRIERIKRKKKKRKEIVFLATRCWELRSQQKERFLVLLFHTSFLPPFPPFPSIIKRMGRSALAFSFKLSRGTHQQVQARISSSPSPSLLSPCL